MQMPFGKWRGYLISEIPSSYLHWLLRAVSNLDPELRGRAEGVLNSRGKTVEPAAVKAEGTDLRPVFKAWFGGLARDYHPDRTHDDGRIMAALNDAYERLRKATGL